MNPIISKAEQNRLVRLLTLDLLPKISVIIPSLNQGKFIGQTLESIFAQDYPNIEIFISDGGSEDQTEEVVKSFQARHEGIITYSSLKDGSHSAGVRRGIEATSGDIIAWINSDDLYTPEAFWEVVKFFAFNDSALVMFGDNDYVDEDLNFKYKYPVDYSFSIRQFRLNMQFFCQIPQPSLFFRRSIFQYVEGPNSRVIDYEMWLRWMREVHFVYVPIKLSLSRLHSESITINAEKVLLDSIIRTVYKEYGVVSYAWVRKKHEVLKIGNFGSERITKSLLFQIRFLARIEWLSKSILYLPMTFANVSKELLAKIKSSAKAY